MPAASMSLAMAAKSLAVGADDDEDVTIPGDSALDILLPPHAGEPCKGDQLTLVPDHGAPISRCSQRNH